MGPMALGAVRVNERPVMLAGVDFEEVRILKPWWKIEGVPPDANGLWRGPRPPACWDLRSGHPEIAGNPVSVTRPP